MQRLRHQQICPLRGEDLEHGRRGGARRDVAEHRQRGLEAVQVRVPSADLLFGPGQVDLGGQARHGAYR